MCTVRRLTNEPLYEDRCPLCRQPLRPECRRRRPSAQQNQPAARVWFTGYRCDGCEATLPQQWAEVMRARYET
ncbi:hypothetical protein R6L23_01285 [Streptomyces sp. SR27]|uniref:hypothetical protein n=1 Tax=Streptomyces sp. SR27 TaxID=3076630 RepID=UPI00295B9E9A|nr:hypothetical protein [Streptomyces sp. SR27]MDV9186874.1 hypothetical protein [Streptomyces sp. SR27]